MPPAVRELDSNWIVQWWMATVFGVTMATLDGRVIRVCFQPARHAITVQLLKGIEVMPGAVINPPSHLRGWTPPQTVFIVICTLQFYDRGLFFFAGLAF